MSIKKKLATAVATAGLLSGIFGSAFAPVAQAASTAVNYALIRGEFSSNAVGDVKYQQNDDIQVPGVDGISSPFIIYSPVFNTGASGDEQIESAVCTYVDVDDVETIGGDDLLDADDVAASVTTTGTLIVYGEDFDGLIDGDGQIAATGDDEGTEGNYGSTYTDNNVVDGVSVCFTVNDDDASSKSETATLKINGATAAVLSFRIVGPGKSMTLADRTGGWVAMDNESVDDAFGITFLDAAGNELFTSLRRGATDTNEFGFDAYEGNFDTEDLIEDFWLDGYEAEGSDLDYIQDVASTGDDFNITGSLDMGSTDGTDYARIDLTGSSSLCDSSVDAEFGLSHKVWAVMDLGNGGTFTSGDTASNPVTVKCSAWGDEALVTGIDFGTATTVELGGSIPFYVRIQDGYGNPIGVGTTDDLQFGFADYMNGYVYDQVDDDYITFVPSPIHLQDGNDGYQYLDLDGAMTEVEAYDDGDTVCNGVRGYEDGYTLEGEDSLDYLINVTGGDKLEAGVVVMCYFASSKIEDLGRNTLRTNMLHPYTVTLADVYDAGDSPVTYTAGITLVREKNAAAGATFGASVVKAGKRSVSVTGPIGAKITFVVENANGNTKTYNRVVNATTGKATLKIKKNGTFDVYAMYGDSITSLLRIRIK